MDKTISIIVTVMVLMAAGVILVAMSSGSLSDLDQSSDNIGDQGCEFQQQRALENPEYEEQMSSECKTEEFEQMKEGE